MERAPLVLNLIWSPKDLSKRMSLKPVYCGYCRGHILAIHNQILQKVIVTPGLKSVPGRWILPPSLFHLAIRRGDFVVPTTSPLNILECCWRLLDCFEDSLDARGLTSSRNSVGGLYHSQTGWKYSKTSSSAGSLFVMGLCSLSLSVNLL